MRRGSLRAALIQLHADGDKERNLIKAQAMVQRALRSKAGFVLLPEMFSWRGDAGHPSAVEAAETVPGPTLWRFAKLAKSGKAYILLGSILERSIQPGKFYNTSILIDPAGNICAKYRKIHLFHARLGDRIHDEPKSFIAGKRGATARVGAFKVGLSVCYDLRFPDMYQTYAASGANLMLVPSCFTRPTGEAHWEVLLRARAIENLSYVLAPDQVGMDRRGKPSYGNSMVVAPWGEVIARGSGDKEEVVMAELNMEKVNEARRKLPSVISLR